MKDKVEYYKLPFRFDRLINNQELEKCDSLGISIYENIHLILMTSFGEYRMDNSYGCAIWERDFENISSLNKWKDEILTSITGVIIAQEPRLTDIKVTAKLTESELKVTGRSRIQRIKKMVEIKVVGKETATNEPFKCTDRLYVSPLSVEE